ncbi:hypothetical protein ACIBAG_12590 [Streptomyces sp. NPDC051243]|uniref:hypothetical protein n=1 Tax=Streptomyces sp. NPDC051243 TaxID=3365646 RepID=UPI0037B44811
MVELLAWAGADGGAHARAARLLGVADALWHDAGSSICAFGPQLAEQHARCEQAAIGALGEATYRKAFAEGGKHHTPGRAVDFALAGDSAADPGSDADTPYDGGTDCDGGIEVDGGIGVGGDIDVREPAPDVVWIIPASRGPAEGRRTSQPA